MYFYQYFCLVLQAPGDNKKQNNFLSVLLLILISLQTQYLLTVWIQVGLLPVYDPSMPWKSSNFSQASLD